jgi:hypothetical protein
VSPHDQTEVQSSPVPSGRSSHTISETIPTGSHYQPPESCASRFPSFHSIKKFPKKIFPVEKELLYVFVRKFFEVLYGIDTKVKPVLRQKFPEKYFELLETPFFAHNITDRIENFHR